MKRFYCLAAVQPGEGGYVIVLDGKAVRTPGGRTLAVASAALADAIAEEWLAQDETIKPESMPLTQLSSTALDRVMPNRAAIVGQLLNYAKTDLLCYRADGPQDLVDRQERVWQPLVDWAAAAFDVELHVTRGIMPVDQPEETLTGLAAVLDGCDDMLLTALQSAVAAMGSLLLGLALIEGKLGAEAAFAASQLDESYQAELWGEDSEARKARKALRNDIAAAGQFIALYFQG